SARREVRVDARTVLARKGSLRRAKTARPCALRAVLAGWICDGRLRRDELAGVGDSPRKNPKQKPARRRLHRIADAPRKVLANRYLDHGVAPRLGVVDSCNNPPDHPLDQPPPVSAENDDRDFPPFEILLIGEVI